MKDRIDTKKENPKHDFIRIFEVPIIVVARKATSTRRLEIYIKDSCRYVYCASVQCVQ